MQRPSNAQVAGKKAIGRRFEAHTLSYARPLRHDRLLSIHCGFSHVSARRPTWVGAATLTLSKRGLLLSQKRRNNGRH